MKNIYPLIALLVIGGIDYAHVGGGFLFSKTAL
jgi:hypothetical protein